jgi:penicillin-binding protein 2
MNRLLFSVFYQNLVWILFFSLLASLASGATPLKKKRRAVSTRKVVAPTQSPRLGVIQGGPWTRPTFADSTDGDRSDGEDLDIRRAAVEALGPYNGSVVVVDPTNGRVLSMVNQKLAFSPGFQPCSTIKVSVALAALSEKVIQPQTRLRVHGKRMDLTYALAHSNNYFFASLGQKLGFEKFSVYAEQFGYGERAGLDIPGEQPGRFPAAPPRNGGVAMLASFGEEISQTPLQFAALMAAVTNGGTLHYLQYPRTPLERAQFVPRVKRHLVIETLISGIKPGMRGAVEFGTAHRARQEEPIAGKTGTCSEDHTHLGWFGAFNDVGGHTLVVVVLLTGGRPAIGSLAAGIAGDIYRRLKQQNYFATSRPPIRTTILNWPDLVHPLVAGPTLLLRGFRFCCAAFLDQEEKYIPIAFGFGTDEIISGRCSRREPARGRCNFDG